MAFWQQHVITGVSKDDVNVDDFEQIPGTKRVDSWVEWERSLSEPFDVNSSNILGMLDGILEREDDSSKNSKRR